MTYALGFAIIKYNEGFVFIPGLGGEHLSLHDSILLVDLAPVVPKPFQLWDDTAKGAIFPLYLTFSVAWSLEM